MSTTNQRLATAVADRYRLERELGQGGMATVYLAEDLKHDRKVAIKVLKPELAAVLGAERFVQEIKTTAAMSHPHILPLFDSGTADGFLFYVMPFIQGETIREKLNRETQFGVEEAVRIAREVADALDYAHRHGVIHRDIKPENILLHDGRAMVMDFGIALAVSAAAGGRMTETGLSLGTPHYMSPEQATADKEISGRSDVYSLASVLYEMLAGQPPHLGGSAQQIIMKIIAETPQNVTALRRSVPPNVAAALSQALEKLPADRFESASAFGQALANPAFGTGGIGGASAAELSRNKVSTPVFVATASIAVLAIIAAAAFALRKPVELPQPVFRVQATLPDSFPLESRYRGSRLNIARSGATIGYASSRGLWYRPSDQLELRPMPIRAGSLAFALSDDGKRVAAISPSGSILVASLDGAPPTTLPGRYRAAPFSWVHDSALIVTSGGILARVSVAGGTVTPLSTRNIAANEESHSDADLLPNGKGVLFTIARTPSTLASLFDIAVLDLGTGEHQVLAHGIVARYALSGHLVYVTAEGVMMAAPFDQDRLALTGAAVAVRSDIQVRSTGGIDFALSSSGTMMLVAGVSAGSAQRELIWVDRAGAVTPLDTAWHGTMDAVAISPDGHRLAVSVADPVRTDVWVRQLDNRTLTKLTFDATLNLRPSWLPGGDKVAWLSNLRGKFAMDVRRADGVGGVDRLAGESRSFSQGFITRDGKWVIYRTNANEPGGGDIVAMRVGDSIPVPLVATPAEERFPALSPDGRSLAYMSAETGNAEVYVKPFPNVGEGKWTVSAGGGQEPIWSHDGKELFYINGKSEMVSVAVESQPAFTVRSQRVLFTLPAGVFRAISHQAFDIAPDDRRFLMIRDVGPDVAAQSERPGAAEIVVVHNWFEELKRQVPVRK